MNKQILVSLEQSDRIEEMIPYIEDVARPGMKVIFLVRYPVDGFIRAKEEYGMRAALEARKLVTYYSWEGNLESARKQVAPACEALRSKGIEAVVDVYAGSLKRANAAPYAQRRRSFDHDPRGNQRMDRKAI
jgi:hypothetical protein